MMFDICAWICVVYLYSSKNIAHCHLSRNGVSFMRNRQQSAWSHFDLLKDFMLLKHKEAIFEKRHSGNYCSGDPMCFTRICQKKFMTWIPYSTDVTK